MKWIMILVALSSFVVAVTLCLGMWYWKQQRPEHFSLYGCNRGGCGGNHPEPPLPTIDTEPVTVKNPTVVATDQEKDSPKETGDITSTRWWFGYGRDAFTPRSWRSSNQSSRSQTSFGWIGRIRTHHPDASSVQSSSSPFPTLEQRQMKLDMEHEFMNSGTSQRLPDIVASHDSPTNIQYHDVTLPSLAETSSAADTEDGVSSLSTHNTANVWLTVSQRRLRKESSDTTFGSKKEPSNQQEWEDEALERMTQARKLASPDDDV